ncbi:FGGY-family carbohydrate kinase [Labrys wisconsinensis]|uniref:Sugar (Pentulose or hexulose) kinase n=1 Tax=Labrys wisconsinensis TaxID=425677 RepID=A0ABU0J5V8_9HYPH|nr:FGGY-family carbohydrate kinase [Labrys wisconsinensis]MDQ0469644.1 sugar (pentulose or hexulose) kinase [Labrys wisconsinensis]
MSLVIGIDIGTSGVRAMAVDERGRIMGEARTALPAPERRGAAVTQDPGLWWTACEASLAVLARQIDPAAVAALAVDGTSGTMLAVDAAGEPLGPGRLYNDGAAEAAAALIGRLAPATSAAHGVTSGLAKAIELAASGPARILHQADWVAGRLSGRFDVSDENNALKTGYDPVARAWPDWIAETGFDRGLLPDVVEPGTAVAPVLPAIAARFGFPAGAIVASGTTDGCASFLATGADLAGDAVSALGTTLTVKLLSDVPIFSPAHGIYSHRLGERWLAGGASNSGGAALLQFFTPERMAELEPRLDPARDSGLDYYPLPKPGERFPVADPALAPRLTPRPADDALFLQGLLEGVAAVEAQGYRLLAELGGPKLRRVISVGGGAKNAAWTAIRARKLGVAVSTAATDEAAYGTARLARLALSRPAA